MSEHHGDHVEVHGGHGGHGHANVGINMEVHGGHGHSESVHVGAHGGHGGHADAGVHINVGGHHPGAMPGQPHSEQWKPGKEHKKGGHGHDSDSSSDDDKKEPRAVPIKGYESANFKGAVALAPPPPPASSATEAAPQKFESVSGVNDEQAKHALIKYVSDHMCFKKECAEKMDIKKMTTAGALHYTLETFVEHREIKYVHEPYRNQPIDGPENGSAPAPWTINCNPESEFKDHNKKVEVPHSAVVKPCYRCKGKGHTKCKNCKGDGDKSCHVCDGSGTQVVMNAEGQEETRSCPHCTGGKIRCQTCGGDGKVKCAVCDGHKNLKLFIQMTCSFKTEKDDFIHEKSDLPDHLIKGVQGELVFEQVNPQVNPIMSYSVDDVNKNSVRLVEKHRGSYNDKRKLKQRQRLRAVPVTEVEYHWKEVKDRYWVYGKEKKVYAPTYPQQSCCTVL